LLQELDDNTDQVEAILTAILASLSAPDAALAQGIPMPAICASIDGANPTYVIPIVLLNQSTGEIVGKNYVDSTGNPIIGEVSELDSCDCKDCTSCTEDNSTTDISFLLDNVATIGYDADYTSGIRIEFFTDLDSGYDVEPKQYLLDLPVDPTGTEDTHQIIVTQGNIVDINGVQQSLPFSIPFHNNGNGNNSSSEAVFNFSSNFVIDTGIPWEPSTINLGINMSQELINIIRCAKDEIVTRISNQTGLSPLQSITVNVDGQPVNVTPIVKYEFSTGQIIETVYVDSMGSWEAFLENKPYSIEAGDLTLNSGPYTVIEEENADGTFSYLFSGTNPISNFATVSITGTPPVPPGNGAGLSLYSS